MSRGAKIPLDSDALRANIKRTAQEVEIPARYLPLLAAVEKWHGVRESLRETLQEYFHQYRNVNSVLEGLQTVLLRNWKTFERSEDRANLFRLLSELPLLLLDQPLTDKQTSALLRQLAKWCAACLDGEHGELYESRMIEILRSLDGLIKQAPAPFLERDNDLRRLIARAIKREALAEQVTDLHRQLLHEAYSRAASHLDVASWMRSGRVETNEAEKAAACFQQTAANRIAELTDRLAEADGPALVSGEFPLYSDLVADTLGSLDQVGDLEDRFAVCLFLLKDDTLGYRDKEVMVRLLAVVKKLLAPERMMDFIRLLDHLTAFFHQREELHPDMRFQIYQVIGEALGKANIVRAANHLTDDLISWKFEYADIRGATSEWQTLVNPYHLANIRCWLRIIASNPLLYERLAAALQVQLRLGGVFIADTDLFQRDITEFLNANIRPIFFVARQLLGSFPVFFNDVGAEGELRSVSTEIDEICRRRDSLMHFVRKQVHAESSNRLVEFCRATLHYWTFLDPSQIAEYLPPNIFNDVLQQQHWADGPHALLQALMKSQSFETNSSSLIDSLLDQSPDPLQELLLTVDCPDERDRRRVYLLVRLYQLLEEKYSLAVVDYAFLVERRRAIEPWVRKQFTTALAGWQAASEDPHVNDAVRTGTRNKLLDAALCLMEELNGVILSPRPSEGHENIYHKRHIAAGIPSMYGHYSEPKFDALGLSFRIERLVARLLEEINADFRDKYATRESLRRMSEDLQRFERALAAGGIQSQNTISANLRLLQVSFGRANFTFQQYQNIFKFLSHTISNLVRVSVRIHDRAIRQVLEHDQRHCESYGLSPEAVAEVALREILVNALGLQTLDNYIASAHHLILSLSERLDGPALTRMMNYDPETLVSWLHEPNPMTDDQITLGYKALAIKQLAAFGQKVPPGFILTTELFSVLPALRHRAFYEDTNQRIHSALDQLQEITGLRLGDPEALLTLSIRSGAAVSMPGLMTTFINVGLNDELTEAMSQQEGRAWMAWDSYRRFIQCWAMSSGVDRDFFDSIMTEFKHRYDVGQKLDFSAEQMRELALTYKSRATDKGVRLVEDPHRQVTACVREVLRSWDSERAQIYRNHMGVASEWGTAVIVQKMVFGNLSRQSGSGVTFTRNPLEPPSRKVRLFGDYTLRSQGEDLVGGLVNPLPISEAQRLGSAAYAEGQQSLERDFPDVYNKLRAIAEELVNERDHDALEIEFTFESPRAEDLHLLQKRPMVMDTPKEMIGEEVDTRGFPAPSAFGMGVAGGLLAGRVAIDPGQIDEILARNPEDTIILLRPDTVPEDIGMILRVHGILTARGGSTSHAAVTAKRLGKVAIVDCRTLDVRESERIALLNGHQINPGDWLTIDGRAGHVYLDKLK